METVINFIFFSSVQMLSHVQLFVTPWTVAYQAFLSFTISWSLLIFMSIELMKSPNRFIFCHPFLLKRRVLQCVFFNCVPYSGSCNLFYFFLPSRRRVSLRSESLRISVMKLATDFLPGKSDSQRSGGL